MTTLKTSISTGIATLTFDRPSILNAITEEDYAALAEELRRIDRRDDVVITLLQATGKWFCAGTDIKAQIQDYDSLVTERDNFLGRVASPNTDCSRAVSVLPSTSLIKSPYPISKLYTHSKILVAALNGPVMGIAAAFLGHFDLIYCMPNAWLQVPFSFLGVIAEAGSSVSFVNRIGLSKANEVLIFGKRMEADEMRACGYVNKIFPKQSCESFHGTIRRYLEEQIDGLNPRAMLKIKQLIQLGINEKNSKDAVNLRESYAQAECFATGIPTRRLVQLVDGQIRHRL
ncbi:hypothetical protein ACEPAG_5021 [Sanghuangporus baumii]